jgi:hypothetical protein
MNSNFIHDQKNSNVTYLFGAKTLSLIHNLDVCRFSW